MNDSSLTTQLLVNNSKLDRFACLFDSEFVKSNQGNFVPSYNVEKYGENAYCILMALPGFDEKDIDITIKRGSLTIIGHYTERDTNEKEYLYKSIDTNSFEQSFSLADHMKVKEAKIKNGVLKIMIKREIPDEEKPQKILLTSD